MALRAKTTPTTIGLTDDSRDRLSDMSDYYGISSITSLIELSIAIAYRDLDRRKMRDAKLPIMRVSHVPDSEQHILRQLANGAAALRTICQPIDGMSGQSLRQAIYRLAAAGRVARVDGGRTGSPATYALINAAQ